MPRTSEPGRSVSSRLLDVLFAFEPGRSEMSLSDLVRSTGMPFATVRRYALELTEAGALKRDAQGIFTVGLKLWRLGTLAPFTEPLRSQAQPFMEDLYTALRQHVQLAVLEGDEAVVIERLSAPSALGLVSQVGGRLPLHCSAVGKILLSHAPAEVVDSILDRGLRAYTPQTITDPARLRAELARCRSTGTAAVRAELSEGAHSYAARILNTEGRVVAALSVVVRAGSVKEHAILPAVVTSGLSISRLLGWQPTVRVRTD
ncbi:IclR family transcriptional regulator [Streptomyces sp. NPDC052043]|uniref:IclR family transcriptional regulator n=1 Tax=Streptomyces sp. NPDC052043 TaxID=3365684 RepID=UPI0037D12B17